jgi:Uma2 family endonuclease
MGAVRTLLTFEQFEQLPEKPGRQELLEGELIELPPPFIDHDESSHNLFQCFHSALQRLRTENRAELLGRAYIAVGYHLDTGSYLIPDVSISHANQRRTRYLEGAPALAVEMVSKCNTPALIDRKVRLFLAHGSREVWVIYPEQRHIWVHQTPSNPRVCSGRFRSDLLPGIEIDLDEILGP